MNRKNLPYLLIALAMLLIIIDYDFSSEVGSRKFWVFIFSCLVLAASVILMIRNKKTD